MKGFRLDLIWLQLSESDDKFFRLAGIEMEEERRDMKAHKAYINMLDFVADAQQGIPKLCPYGSIIKEIVDEEDTYDYLPGKKILHLQRLRGVNCSFYLFNLNAIIVLPYLFAV